MSGPQYFEFPNIGYILDTIPPHVEHALRQEIARVMSDFAGAKSESAGLAGHIQKEYSLQESKKLVEPYVINLMAEYDTKCTYLKSINILQKPQKYFLDTLWVNFQSKHEFNPVHSHAGVISFVIWLDIPYKDEDEKKVFLTKPEQNRRNGKFGFYYTNSIGQIQAQFLQPEGGLQNKIAIFPSSLAHAVYPFFTSDEYRVSVSGNIKFAFKQH